MRRRQSFLVWALCALAAAVLSPGAGRAQSPPVLASLSESPVKPPVLCGTTPSLLDPVTYRMRPQAAVDGELISFSQSPAIIFSDHRGPVALQQFIVAGDVPVLEFVPFDSTVEAPKLQTWARVATTTVAGRLTSVFESSWSNDVLLRAFSRQDVGIDQPYLYWGTARVPGADASQTRSIYLRVAHTSLPSSLVHVIDPSAQFASHVVNLVLEGYGDARVSENWDVDHRRAARLFYTHFRDEYESLAIGSDVTHMWPFGAYYRRVRNDVVGLGLSQFNSSASFGSASGALLGIEFYPGVFATDVGTVTHEIGHQWGHAFDWTRIAGIGRAGHQPSGHAPLTYGTGETLMGAVLYPGRRVARAEDGSYRIEATPPPFRHNPLELYAMGFVGPESVATSLAFHQQDQFNPTSTAFPAVGTPVQGDATEVSINAIMGAHGARTGPVHESWRRALIIVSRDRLISQREMDYWNYFAARIEDPNRKGVLSVSGYGSVELSTHGRLDVHTRIFPRDREPILQVFDTDYPAISQGDCTGFELDTAVPRLMKTGARVRIEGRATATDRSDFHQMLVRLWKYRGTEADAVTEYASVSSSGRFRVELEPRPAQAGQYWFQMFLFWPDGGPQGPRCFLSPVTIE